MPSFAEVTSQDSVIVSENFRYRFAVQRGDRVTLPTPEGPRSFRVAGVSIDYSSDQGTIVMHWGTFRKYWTEHVVDTIGVFLRPGASLEAVAAEIKQRFGRSHRLFIFSNQAFKEEIYQLIDQSFVITYALEIIAIAVGIMGIATALYTSVLERQRETSVLRALGAFRQQIRKIIMLESGLLGLLGVGGRNRLWRVLIGHLGLYHQSTIIWLDPAVDIPYLDGGRRPRPHLPDGAGGGHLAGPSGREGSPDRDLTHGVNGVTSCDGGYSSPFRFRGVGCARRRVGDCHAARL